MLLLYDTELFDNKGNPITGVKSIALSANKDRGRWEARIQTSEFFKADVNEINIVTVGNSTALQIFLAEKKRITL